ncbi:MAG: hypothetical protein ACXVRJ_13475 [Gaiellaceae bacterium]
MTVTAVAAEELLAADLQNGSVQAIDRREALLRPERSTEIGSTEIDAHAAEQRYARLRDTAVLLSVLAVQVVWLAALGYGLYALVF